MEANTACYIEFELGRSNVLPGLGNNGEEISRIKTNLKELIENETYELDSILVTASSSPEGKWDYNATLAQKRSEAVSEYFCRYMSKLRDSLQRENGISLNVDDSYVPETKNNRVILFTARSNPENWRMLAALVREDSLMTSSDKDSYFSLASHNDPDNRERAMQ